MDQESSRIEDFYRQSEAYAEMLARPGRHSVAAYVQFIRDNACGRELLEVGCGAGQASVLLAVAGFEVTAVDLSRPALARAVRAGGASGATTHLACSVTALPFADASFDVVSAQEVLEHLPQPVRALAEMARVVRPGGCLILMGPNLLSPVYSALALASCLRQSPRTWILGPRRRPRFPFGDSIPTILAILLRNFWYWAGLLLRSGAVFHYRVPDFSPVGGDADAICLADPLSVSRVLSSHGLTVQRTHPEQSRTRWMGLFGGYIQIVAVRKLAGMRDCV